MLPSRILPSLAAILSIRGIPAIREPEPPQFRSDSGNSAMAAETPWRACLDALPPIP